jgi:hypothetical protein
MSAVKRRARAGGLEAFFGSAPTRAGQEAPLPAEADLTGAPVNREGSDSPPSRPTAPSAARHPGGATHEAAEAAAAPSS